MKKTFNKDVHKFPES